MTEKVASANVKSYMFLETGHFIDIYISQEEGALNSLSTIIYNIKVNSNITKNHNVNMRLSFLYFIIYNPSINAEMCLSMILLKKKWHNIVISTPNKNPNNI